MQIYNLKLLNLKYSVLFIGIYLTL